MKHDSCLLSWLRYHSDCLRQSNYCLLQYLDNIFLFQRISARITYQDHTCEVLCTHRKCYINITYCWCNDTVQDFLSLPRIQWEWYSWDWNNQDSYDFIPSSILGGYPVTQKLKDTGDNSTRNCPGDNRNPPEPPSGQLRVDKHIKRHLPPIPHQVSLMLKDTVATGTQIHGGVQENPLGHTLPAHLLEQFIH